MQISLLKMHGGVRLLARRWVPLVAIGFALLATWERVASQDATPTPDVSTVPRPADIFTPTSTPLPAVVPIVTATPVQTPTTALPNSESTTSQGNPSNSGSTTVDPIATPAQPTLPPPVEAQQVGATPGMALAGPDDTNSLVQQDGAALSMTVWMDRAYLWPGQTFTLAFSLENLGTQPVSDVRLQVDLPVEFDFQSATATGLGSVQQGPPTQGKIPMLMVWPSLAPDEQVIATLTLQVAPQTTNGRLIDTQIVAGVAGRVDITTDMTVVMPPAELPQF